MSSFHHRSLFGKQKPFKGKSKGKLKRQNKGKVDDDEHRTLKGHRNVRDAGQRKRQLRNTAKQLQKEKRNDIMRAKRIGSRGGPPRIIAFLPISVSADITGIRQEILNRAKQVSYFNDKKRQYKVRLAIDGREHDFIIYDPPRDQTSILDAAKAADIIVPVIHCTGPTSFDVDRSGDHLVSLIKAQGIPSVIGLTTLDMKMKAKARTSGSKLCKRWFASVFESPKNLVMDNTRTVETFLRNAATIKLAEITWKAPRPHLIAESVHFTPITGSDGSRGILRVTGYLRGERGLSARQLVHITGYDDFQIARIISAGGSGREKSMKASKGTSGKEEMDMELQAADEKGNQNDTGSNVISSATEEERTSLLSLNPVDTANENIITEEELGEAATEQRAPPPPGMEGIIEDVWRSIVSDEEEEAGEGKDIYTQIQNDVGSGSKCVDALSTSERIVSDEEVEAPDEDDTLTKLRASMAALKKNKRDTLEDLQKLETDEMEFPDEVEIHPDTVAKRRYAKYRGLKNFRNSEWDTKQNLPVEYGHIFQFQDFAAAKRRVLTSPGGGCGGFEAMPGHRVTIEVVNVPRENALEMCGGTSIIMLWGLFLYERKVSILHYLIKRHDNEDDLPVKSKAPMHFSVGFRRFTARPIYTQDCKSNKFKTDRFLRTGEAQL